MNELSTVTKLENMMQELISININSEKKIDKLSDRVDSVASRMDDFEKNSEVTTQQKNTIRRAVRKQVYTVLGLPEKKSDWSLENKLDAKKYSALFFQRCYSETTHKGHLSSPYETTISQNFTQAIRDIEAWTPSNGVAALKKEADDNAIARKIAEEQGYK